MMQQEKGDDYVLATGVKITVREFVSRSFKEAGIDIEWQGKGSEEKGINKKTGEVVVEIDKEYFRPSEVDCLIGDASKARKILKWEPKYTVDDLIKEMVASDLKLFERDKYLLEGGHDIRFEAE
jgi:GDPmannose 4,6-dehydratase